MDTPIKTISLEDFDLSLSQMRIFNPGRVARMKRSLSLNGQLQPVVARSSSDGIQLIDGFKRYEAAISLGLPSLEVRCLTVELLQAKVLLMSYNRLGQSMEVWEEALVLHDLKVMHRLDLLRLSQLTGYSLSWVSRRLSLISKADEALSHEIKMGTISTAHARELVRLPRGNQKHLTKVVTSHSLSSRQSARLVRAFMQARDKTTQDHILEHPLAVLQQQDMDSQQAYDARLSAYGNELCKSAGYLKKSLDILTSRLQDPRLQGISQHEREILYPKMRRIAGKCKQLTDQIAHF